MDRGRYTTFAAPGVPVTSPVGINDRGQISGFTSAPSPEDPLARAYGFLLARGVGGTFTPIRFPGAPGSVATGLNDRGQIVGSYDNVAPSPQDGSSTVVDMPGLLRRAG